MTVIKLDCEVLSVVGQEFLVDHAEALLQLEASMGINNWVITPDTGYIFRNGTIERTDSKADKNTSSRKPAPGGS